MGERLVPERHCRGDYVLYDSIQVFICVGAKIVDVAGSPDMGCMSAWGKINLVFGVCSLISSTPQNADSKRPDLIPHTRHDEYVAASRNYWEAIGISATRQPLPTNARR